MVCHALPSCQGGAAYKGWYEYGSGGCSGEEAAATLHPHPSYPPPERASILAASRVGPAPSEIQFCFSWKNMATSLKLKAWSFYYAGLA